LEYFDGIGNASLLTNRPFQMSQSTNARYCFVLICRGKASNVTKKT
jgi:hypothetical protein